MARIPIALRLFTLREEMAKEPEGTIKAVAAMGYEGAGVEWYVVEQDRSARQRNSENQGIIW